MNPIDDETTRMVARFTAFADLTEQDFVHLSQLVEDHRTVARGEYIFAEGQCYNELYLLEDGWAASSITFADGARSLLKVSMPGDILGLPNIATVDSPHSVVALTPARLASVPYAALGRLFERNPRLSALLFLISQEERMAAMDRAAVMGSTEAKQSLATLLLQLHAGVVRSKPGTGQGFDIPLSQNDLADLTGMSVVHLNRSLQQLRREGLIDWSRGHVTIQDIDGLVTVSGLPSRTLRRNASWLPSVDP